MSDLSVLNVGSGDLRFRWEDEGDAAQARAVVEDLLSSGYAIVVEDEDGVHRVVEAFDPEHDEYIVAALPARARKSRKEPETSGPVELEPRHSRDRARVRVRRRGGWADVVVDGEVVEGSRTLRRGEAVEAAERINLGGDPKESIEKVIEKNRLPAKKRKATAIAPTAGG